MARISAEITLTEKQEQVLRLFSNSRTISAHLKLRATILMTYSSIDEDDLVSCSELYVATFGESPWNEEWSLEDAFERLSDFLACPKSIAIKAIYDGNICGFLFGELSNILALHITT